MVGAGLGNKHTVTVLKAMYGLCARKLQGKITFQAGEQQRKGGQGHGVGHYGGGLQNRLRIRYYHVWGCGKGGKCPWQGVGLAEQGKASMFGEFAQKLHLRGNKPPLGGRGIYRHNAHNQTAGWHKVNKQCGFRPLFRQQGKQGLAQGGGACG